MTGPFKLDDLVDGIRTGDDDLPFVPIVGNESTARMWNRDFIGVDIERAVPRFPAAIVAEGEMSANSFGEHCATLAENVPREAVTPDHEPWPAGT